MRPKDEITGQDILNFEKAWIDEVHHDVPWLEQYIVCIEMRVKALSPDDDKWPVEAWAYASRKLERMR